MTREEAIFCEKSYLGETSCTNCKYYGTDTCQSRESHRMAIKALEQESVLDQISEIIEPLRHVPIDEMSDIEWDILRVVDKYKGESEK